MIKIGVIGSGYWGKHHLRIFSQLPCELIGVADINPEHAKLAEYFKIPFYKDYRKLLKKADAVTVVTPPTTHYEIAKTALLRKKHVLLEKPFVLKLSQAQRLYKLAEKNKVHLMAGHTFLYNPAVRLIRRMLTENKLGRIYYLTMEWMNLGIIRSDVNALWNFAPHPFSILNYLFEKLPVKVSFSGLSFIQNGIEDFVSGSLFYENGIVAHLVLSWLHPVKIRQITLVGSKKLVRFDDVNNESPVEIFDKGITPEEFLKYQSWDNFAEFKAKKRYGLLEIPEVDKIEPLKEELREFINVSEGKVKLLSDQFTAVSTIALLEAAQKSMMKKGKIISVSGH